MLPKRILLLATCLLGLLSPCAASGGPESLTAKSLSVAGLEHEEALGAIFRGDFLHVDFNREDLHFATLLHQYLKAYSQYCGAHLPANKVEMMQQRCTREQVTRNGFGVELSRTCISYVDEGTGIYAKPEMLGAMQEIDRIMAAESLRNTWRLLTASQENPLAGTMELAQLAQSAARDMTTLVRKNACSGPGLRRFEENLQRFAWNKRSIRLPGESGKDSASSPETLARTLDYPRLIAALVADQSRSWVLNRFVGGSVRGVTISSRDAQGLPSEITANYTFDGFSGRTQGSVRVELTDALPTCMYFWDARNVCRTPSRRIVSSYAEKAQNVNTPPASNPPPVSNPPPTSKAPLQAESAERTPAPTTTPRRRSRAVQNSTSNPGAVAGPNSTSRGAPKETAPPRRAPPQPPPPKRTLHAVSYIQGIKDACLEVLTGGERREPEAGYCFCLSAASGAASISNTDARWFFENFSDEARRTMEQKYPPLARMFGSCQTQFDARKNPG